MPHLNAHPDKVHLTHAAAADSCVSAEIEVFQIFCTTTSVSRLGDLLDFGQVFKAFGSNYFTQIDPHC